MEVIDEINYQGLTLYIWGDLDEPWFLARDVGELLYINHRNATSTLLRMISPRNVTTSKVGMSGRRYHMKFINEDGLNEVFAHSNHPQARVWHQISIKRLIQLRKDQGLNFKEDVELRDRQSYEDYYFDEEEGVAYIVRKDDNGETYLEEMD